MSARFRTRLREAVARERPELLGAIAPETWRRPWVVHLAPAGRGRKALEYLSRYIHRTAISGARLRWQDDRRVCFSYRDSRTREQRTCVLSAAEFLRRFLSHVLPKGFRRVRTYGWLSPAAKAGFALVRTRLRVGPPPPVPSGQPASVQVSCPRCKRSMQLLGHLGRAPPMS